MLMHYHFGLLVLSLLCVGALVGLILGGVHFAGFSLQQTQQTENKTTEMVMHQHSRRLLMMDILMSETC